MKVIVNFFIFLVISFAALSQNRQITGYISSANKPLEGVLVRTGDSQIKEFSGTDGKYLITIPSTESSIFFEKEGYQTIKVAIASESEINIEMGESDIFELSLEELLHMNVSTVTLKEQKITDVPGIISVVTQEDLRALGIRTVREALTMIAGFNPLQNDDEQILGVRGIFATTNQKILIMRDGHSLNEANLDIPQTEYSLSIENIKKIEIIRGPGASIYGNSSVAAVVNIITVDNGRSRAKVGFGSYGSFNMDSYISKKTDNDGMFVAFGRFSTTGGETTDMKMMPKNGTKEIDATYKSYHYPNNYDAGFRYSNNLISTSFNARRHEYRTYWTTAGAYTNVDSLYAPLRLFQNSVHFDFTFKPKINDKVGFNLQNYADYAILNNYRQTDTIDVLKFTHGKVSNFEWNAFKMGMNYYGYYDYSDKGQILVGGALERRSYLYSWIAVTGKDSATTIVNNKPFIPEGSEVRGAAFVQVQQEITKWLKIDLGGRYDVSENFDASFNPRAAIIVRPVKNLTVKAIYTKAFQAPGYSYRTSNAPFAGSIGDLNPEILTTYQGSIRYDFQKTSFIEIAGFKNELKNLITRLPGNSYYENFGKVGSYGVEAEGRYNHRLFSIFGNYSLLLPDTSFTDEISVKNNIKDNKFRHFPQHNVNGGIIGHFADKVDISLYAQYASKFSTIKDIEVESRTVLNSTIILKNFYKGSEISLSIYNLADTKWMLGDPIITPIEQPGRWFLFSFAYNF